MSLDKKNKFLLVQFSEKFVMLPARSIVRVSLTGLPIMLQVSEKSTEGLFHNSIKNRASVILGNNCAIIAHLAKKKVFLEILLQ